MYDYAILYMDGEARPIFVTRLDEYPFDRRSVLHYTEVQPHLTREIIDKFGRDMKRKYGGGCLLFDEKSLLKERDIKDVIFNGPATIVNWTDGTKTVVKHQPDDDYPYNEETGLALAIVKKVFGNKGNYNNIFKRLLAKGGR